MRAFSIRHDPVNYSAIKKEASVLGKLAGTAVRLRPDLILTTGLGVFSSLLEIGSLAILVPLTNLAAHQPLSPHSPWVRLTGMLGIMPTASFFMLAFFGLLVARTLTQLLATVLTHHLNRWLHAYFATHALDTFIRHLSFNDIQKQSIGHFVSIAGDDAVRAAMIVSNLMRLIPLLALFLLYGALITYQSWQVAAGLVLFGAVILACLWSAFRHSHRLGQLQDRQTRQAGTHFIETLNGLRTVRSFTAEDYMSARFRQMIKAYTASLFKTDAINAFGAAAPTLFLTGAMLIAAAFFIPAAQMAAMLPAVIVGIMMVLRLLPLTSQTLDITLRLTADLKSADNVAQLLDAITVTEMEKSAGVTDLNEPIRRIEFNRVSFRYTSDLPPILRDFSFTFEAGKSYAVSGPSGAGKSTIIDLLLKLQTPQEGAIRINGRDIRTISAGSLRRRAILAEQTVRVVFDSIARNIEFGQEQPRPAIEQILSMVGLDDFIAGLPEGADTQLLYQGSNVSGGQRQRIGLARALLRDSDVLILDESTSALDQATREKVLDNILPRYRDRIIIFVSHDPAVLARVDTVLDLNSPSLEMAAS